MADSLVIANSIELLGGAGGTFSILPGLENTIFALNDGNEQLDLGTHQPTVDILASLITDGERPIGRRSSNRTLSIPISIISDSRDNLTLARELLFQLVDAQVTEQWTLTYTRDSSSQASGGSGVLSPMSCPMVLNCFRAEPATVSYDMPAENQYVFEVVINCVALPYGRSDTPNTVTYSASAAGTTAPPSPIILDTYSVIPAGQTSFWESVTTAVSTGTHSAYCPSPSVNPQVTVPLYYNMTLGGLDFTAGTGTAQLNVIQFWAGFASKVYYNNWANHKSEVRFIVTLYDVNGNTVTSSQQYTVPESNNLSIPAWTRISVRLPVSNQTFDWSDVVGYSIRVQNFSDSNLHNSNVFLCLATAAAPSAALANETRGSIYRMYGIEGTVHTTVNFTIQQQPSTTPTVTALTPGEVFLDPAGVFTAQAEQLGPGGAGGTATDSGSAVYAGGGGGAEYVKVPAVPLTPGNTYTPTILPAQASLKAGAFSGFTNYGTYNNAGPVSSPAFLPSANIPVGTTIVVLIAATGVTTAPTGVSDPVNGTDSYTLLESTSNGNVYGYAYAKFNASAVPDTDDITLTGLVTTGPVEVVVLGGTGLAGYGRPASNAFSGTSAIPRTEVSGFTNSNANMQAGTTDWSAVGSTPTLAVNSSPPGNPPFPQCLEVSSTTSADTPGIVSAMIAVNNGESVEPKALVYMTTQSNMNVNLLINWWTAASGGTLISTTTDTVSLTASTWEWANGTAHVPPSNATYYTVTVEQVSCTASNPLQVALCGAVYTTAIGLVQLGMLLNDSGVTATTPVATGWTHDYGSTAETPLVMDVYHSTGSGVGGDVCAGSYSSSVTWAGLTVGLSLMAGFTQMVFDNSTVITAMGGCSVPLNSATGGVGGSGGTDNSSPPPYQNDGGNGANGASPDGGGGGSSGGYGTGSPIDDDASEFVYSSHTPPPLSISPLPVRFFGTRNNVGGSGQPINQYGGDIYQYGADGTYDTVIVAVIGEPGANPIYVTDTQSNSYTFMRTVTLQDNSPAQLFYCNKNINGGSFGALSPGVDHIVLKDATEAGDYLVLAWVWRNAIVFDTHTGANGQTSPVSTSTTSTWTATGSALNFATDGIFVMAFAEDGNESSAQGSLVQVSDDNVDTNWGSLYTNPGFTAVVDTWWQNATSTSAATYSFSRPVADTVETAIIEMNAGPPSGWAYTTGAAQYFDGTHHSTNEGGNVATITFSGTRCLLEGKIGPDQGQAWVNVDGGSWTVIDNYAQTAAWQQVIFDTGTVPNGTHVITVLVLGRCNPLSTNTYIDLDCYNTVTGGAGNNGVTLTGGAAISPGGSGGNGGANAAGSAGGTGAGGGGASRTSSGTNSGGSGGAGEVILTYFSTLPQFKTAILHRPSLDGSTTLLPYIACATQAVPTNDQVQPLDSGTMPHFLGTYSMMVAAASWNSPASSRTVTVTVNEYERLGGSVTETSSCSLTFTPNSPPPGSGNNIITVGELSLPGKAIPPDNDEAVYFVSVTSTNTSDLIQDVIMIDTMGQTIYINESIDYAQYFVDEPTPDADLGLVLGSQYDRPYAISVLDSAFPSGGPLTVEPGDNILFAYCYEGAPALIANYFPRYYIDRPVS
jgi:hypothetical protein